MCDGRSWCGAKADFIAGAEADIKWAGFSFQSGPMRQSVAGVYVYGRRDGERVLAVHVGEADDIARAIAAHAEAGSPEIAESDCFYWMPQPNARLRVHVAKVITEQYLPTGNAAASPKPAASRLNQRSSAAFH